MSGFNKIVKLREVFELLMSIDWTWACGDDVLLAKRHLWSLKSEFPLQEGGGGRRTYELIDGVNISFYFDDEFIRSAESNLVVEFFDYDEIGPDGWDAMTARYIVIMGELAAGVIPSYSEEVECGWMHDDLVKGYVWKMSGMLLVLALKNEDENLPFRICFRVLPSEPMNQS